MPGPGNSSPATSIGQVSDLHLNQLAASGIPPHLAFEVGISSAGAEEVQRLLNRKTPVGSGLLIPFHDPRTGEALKTDDGQEFVRVRLDDPSLATDRAGNICKYLTRRGAGQYPYITARTARAIREGAPEIILVEGEKKALSAIAHGIVAVGLTGNWGWKVKDKQALLPLLEEFLPRGCTVVVVWDSDAALNNAFVASTRMLQDALRRHGCAIKVLVLPQKGTSKVGLDDFLVANGVDAFTALVCATPTLPGDRQVGLLRESAG